MAKILIVDDSEQMAHLLGEIVSLFGHEATVAHSGERGLELARSLKPDLILLDIMMPHMDGWEFLKRYRQASSSPSTVPVLMISADESIATRKKAAKHKVPLLPKAIEPLLLKDKIESALSESIKA
ncbi:MAG: response regulator [Chloroflexota bacterium]